MQSMTIVLLVCLAVVAAYAQAPAYDAVNIADELEQVEAEVPVHERSERTKRGLLLLKKKILLGKFDIIPSFSRILTPISSRGRE